MLKDYKLLISDLGGVYLDCLNCFHLCSDELNLNYDIFMSYYREELAPSLYDGTLTEEDMWQKVEEKFGIEVNGNILEKHFYPVVVEKTLSLYRSLKEQGIRIVTGSNNYSGHWNISLRLKQFEVFDALYSSHLMHLHKPDKAFYEYIVEKEDVKCKECIFIDDLEENLIEPRALGMKTFLFNLKDELNFKNLDDFLKSL